MTKDERIYRLKQIEKDIYVCSLDATFEEIAKSCAIRSAIEELEGRRWIPVTERLPEESGMYIVSVILDDFVIDVGEVNYDANEKAFGINEDEQKVCVTAWMPLPKPYEGSEEDEDD